MEWSYACTCQGCTSYNNSSSLISLKFCTISSFGASIPCICNLSSLQVTEEIFADTILLIHSFSQVLGNCIILYYSVVIGDWVIALVNHILSVTKTFSLHGDQSTDPDLSAMCMHDDDDNRYSGQVCSQLSLLLLLFQLCLQQSLTDSCETSCTCVHE